MSSCNAGYGDCSASEDVARDGCETDLNTDENSCGACGDACSNTNGTPTCASGQCSMACNAGYGDCSADENASRDGCETDTNTNTANCGGCAQACSTTNGTPACAGGQCSMSSCNGAWLNCSADENVSRDGCETDTNNDATNCGSCGNDCTDDYNNATGYCNVGACQMGACDAGYGDCTAANGCETDLNTDTAHCGGCSQPCGSANGTPACAGGACSMGCDVGFDDCSADENISRDGCETNTTNDLGNCGGCGTACDDLPANSAPACNASVCEHSCDAGWSDCNGDLNDAVTNGCETNTDTNLNNCGGCGAAFDCTLTAPANMTATGCSLGTCQFVCNAGFADCNSDLIDGCEVDLNTDVDNCGGCSSACGTANGTPSCVGGTCSMACNVGFSDCSADENSSRDGCETNTASNTANCGGCGQACSTTHGTASCTASQCSMSSCDAGWGDCSASENADRDGCETNTNTDSTNCGSCGNDCTDDYNNATGYCSVGTCTMGACDAGYGDCTAANGCETDLGTDTSHCGACSDPCGSANGTPACAAGVCSMSSCTGAWLNCNAEDTFRDGCETDSDGDIDNCGGCGNDCAASAPPNMTATGCTAGSCDYVCDAGFADCTAAAGCETNLNTDRGLWRLQRERGHGS
jgi:hypothetical protein